MERVAKDQFLGDRDKQEDAVRVVRLNQDDDSSNDLLMLLSDGMGGYAGGEVASNTALDAFMDYFQNGSSNMRPSGRLEESLLAANEAVATEVKRNPELKGMGCTLIGVLSAAGRLAWVSVGDSVLFLMRDGQLTRLNADHSYFGELMELVERGEMTRQEAEANPKKNALLSVLAGAPIKMIDKNVIESQDGDLLILASDGLETLAHDEIEEITRNSMAEGPTVVTERLLSAVKHRGKPKQDNSSVIVMQIPGPDMANFQANTAWGRTAQKSGLPLPVLIAGAAFAGALIVGGIAYALWPDPPEPPVVEPEVVQPPTGGAITDDEPPSEEEGNPVRDPDTEAGGVPDAEGGTGETETEGDASADDAVVPEPEAGSAEDEGSAAPESDGTPIPPVDDSNVTEDTPAETQEDG